MRHRLLGLLLLALPLLAGQGPAWRYTVALQPGGQELRVEATFAPGTTTRFSVDDRSEPFVRDVEVQRRGAWVPVAPAGGEVWELPEATRREVRLRYRFRLAEAARSLRDRDAASRRGDLILAAPSVFLLRPWQAARGAVAALRFDAPPGLGVLCGIFPGPEGDAVIDGTDLENAPLAAFGAFRTLRVEADGGLVEAAVPPAFPAAVDDAVCGWIREGMDNVAGLAGRFPVRRAALFLVSAGRGRGVVFGSIGGRGGAGVTMLASPDLRPEDLAADWMLTHEFLHLCVATLPSRHLWFTEGLATYLEPLARLRRGRLKPEAAWAAFLKAMPEGLPKPGDRGLDRTPTWGRTYWGGALFCLMADLEIRRATENRQSLEDALKSLVKSGATKAVAMEAEAAFRLADRGLEKPVLLKLYRRWATEPVDVDLEALWRRLGIVREGSSVRFDGTAPEAAIRPMR
ncbi:MAG: hypothetical protein U0P81_02495 [Holophagaceae bacterium]